MAAPGNLQWWLNALVVLLAVVGLSLLLWALFADRSRGRRRCPKCWYNLSGAPGLLCSECGYVLRSERAFYRTRRRWRWVVVAAMPLILSGGAMRYKTAQHGWVSLTPTTFLVFLMPSLEHDNQKWYDELVRRMDADRLWHWQWGWLLDRCIDKANPPWQLRIKTRDRWPTDRDVYYVIEWRRRLSGVSWVDRATVSAAVQMPSADAAAPFTIDLKGLGSEWNTTPVIYPWTKLLVARPDGPGATSIQGDAEIRIRHQLGPWISFTTSVFQLSQTTVTGGWAPALPPAPFTLTRKVELSAPITFVEPIEELIKPETSPDLDARVAGSLRLRPLSTGLYLHLLGEASNDLNDLTLGLVIEVVSGTEVIASGTTLIDPRTWTGASVGVLIDDYDALYERVKSGGEGLTLRIRGDAAVALADWDARRCWVGQCTLPLRWETRGTWTRPYWAMEPVQPAVSAEP